ncbi:SIR2 family protein [Modestobacter marinus]|uniref:SIR2-like domain-containing protein n=2 Tax=Modestobacter marinus TaxID=477641 RepID=A0A846LSJ5_9ACTN|nr:SIR2 family protein [Modestobacter marinus]NIH66439.1 hypothetical protein [Modestobacter marinus]
MKFFSNNPRMASFRLREVVRRAAIEGVAASAGTVLIIHNLSSRQLRRLGLDAELHELSSAMRPDAPPVIVWGVEDLEDLAARHSEILADELAARPTVKPPAPQEATKVRRQERNFVRSEAIGELRDIFNREGVSLFLGAGASMDLGLPSWNQMIASLFDAAFSSQLDSRSGSSELTALGLLAGHLNSDSPLQLARYLQQALERGGEDFKSHLRSILYANASNDRPKALLRAISDLCVPTRAGSRVHSVITYNFDDLLEGNLNTRRVRAVAVYEGKTAPTSQELPVYHVHGFLPSDPDTYLGVHEQFLVMSEQGYHQVYSDPFHWTNIVQLNAIREHACLFVGLSMTDPNLRRMLDIGARSVDTARHYAFMRRENLSTARRSVKELKSISDPSLRKFLDMHHGLVEEILMSLGVRVLWFDSFEEITDAVQDLADS